MRKIAYADLGKNESGTRVRLQKVVRSEREERLFREDINKNKETLLENKIEQREQSKNRKALNENPYTLLNYMYRVVEGKCDERLKRGAMKEVTKLGHMSNCRYIKNYFNDDIMVYEIDLDAIQNFIDRFALTHRQKTISNAVRVLKWTLQSAKREGLIKENPFEDERLIMTKSRIKSGRNEDLVEVFTDNELVELKELFKPNLFLSTFTMLLEKTGARPSEALALKIGDIDWRNSIITIQRAFTRVHNEDSTNEFSYKYVADTTKNGLTRKIPVPKGLLSKLREYIEETNKEELILDTRQREGYIFIQKNGSIITAPNMLNIFRRYFNKNPINMRFYMYRYRHTYGTKLAEDGCDVRTLQYLMGHKDITITYTFYVSVTKKMRKAAKDIIDGWDELDEPTVLRIADYN